MVRTHQPGEPTFKVILPQDLDWKPFPDFPPSARPAVAIRQPSASGAHVTRVKVPAGVKLMSHKDPEDRTCMVMSAVLYIELGEQFDGSKVEAYPSGSVIVLAGETWHFHWARSDEYITQATAIRPLGLEYRDPAGDPRNQRMSGN